MAAVALVISALLVSSVISLQAKPTRYAILLSSATPTKDELGLLSENSLKKLKEKAAPLGVVVVEGEKWILELCPSAVIPAAVLHLAFLEERQGKMSEPVKISTLSTTLSNVIRQQSRSSLSVVGLSADDDELVAVPTCMIPFAFDNSPTPYDNFFPDVDNYSLVDKLSGNRSKVGTLKATPTPMVYDNGLVLVSSPQMKREIFDAAMLDVPRLYQQWLRKRWEKAGDLFEKYLHEQLSKNSLLKGLKRSEAADFDAFPPELRRHMEDKYRASWRQQGKSEGEIDQLWSKAKFLGMKFNLLLTFKSVGPQGSVNSSAMLGSVGIGP